MTDSRMLEIAPDTEYNKLLLSEHELYYQTFSVDFHSNYRCADVNFEWKEPTTTRKAFNAIIEKIPRNRGYVFLDCGCGLGHAMYLASFYFDIVYGVELIDEIADIAKQNLMTLLPDNRVYRVFSCDIFDLDAKIIDKTNVFYISSPFMDEILFDRLVKIIAGSLQEVEREIWLVYYYPYCENIMEKYHDVFRLVETMETAETMGKVNFYRHGYSACHGQ
jgi:SAM-dependent methyltransferase